MSEYTTWGDVRGGCGHRHKTIAAAEQCIERDSAGCQRQGGYTDRHVRVLEGDDPDRRMPGRRLTMREWDAYYEEAR